VACEATQTVAQSTVKFAAQLLDERWFESIAAPLERD
jgi:transcriptional regulatory protein LevR